MRQPVLFFLFLIGIVSCTAKKAPETAEFWHKVKLDFHKLDAEGLSGPANGKVAVNYEFCIPRQEKCWKAVSRIDHTAQLQQDSRGRIGCSPAEWLVIGSTHQKNYQRVIYQLAALDYVHKIQETHWE
jgi:hypothetical protein